MCVLCGEFIMQVHWTDQHLDGNQSSTVVVGDNQRARQRNRYHRVNLANKILQYYDLRIDDWTGSKYMLKNKKGKTMIVQDLGSLWPAVEKILHRPIDPLDPNLIQKITSRKNQEAKYEK